MPWRPLNWVMYIYGAVVLLSVKFCYADLGRSRANRLAGSLFIKGTLCDSSGHVSESAVWFVGWLMYVLSSCGGVMLNLPWGVPTADAEINPLPNPNPSPPRLVEIPGLSKVPFFFLFFLSEE